MMVFKLVERSLALLSTVILARVLLPSDFGLIGMAMTQIALIELLSAFGFEAALIQRKRVRRADYDTAWTLGVLLAVAGAIVNATLAYPTSVLYGEPRLVDVILLLSLAFFIRGFENIGLVNFRRRLQFRKEVSYLATVKLLGFLMTVGLTLYWRSYWALVFGVLFSRCAAVVLSYVVEPYRPRLSLAAQASLFSFSKWMLLNSIFVMIASRLPTVMIGRRFDAAAVGRYTIASEIGMMPLTEIVMPINRAVFPGFSRMASDPQELARGFLIVSSALALFVVPASVGIVLVAEPLVRLLLGPSWLEAVPIVEVLALVGGVGALASNNNITLLALGLPRLVAMTKMLEIVVLAIAMLALAPVFGVLGIGYAQLIAAIAATSLGVGLVAGRIPFTVRAYLLNLWRPLVAVAIMGWVVLMVEAMFPEAERIHRPLLLLLTMVLAGAASYFVAITGLWYLLGRPDGAEALIWGRLRAAKGR